MLGGKIASSTKKNGDKYSPFLKIKIFLIIYEKMIMISG